MLFLVDCQIESTVLASVKRNYLFSTFDNDINYNFIVIPCYLFTVILGFYSMDKNPDTEIFHFINKIILHTECIGFLRLINVQASR